MVNLKSYALFQKVIGWQRHPTPAAFYELMNHQRAQIVGFLCGSSVSVYLSLLGFLSVELPSTGACKAPTIKSQMVYGKLHECTHQPTNGWASDKRKKEKATWRHNEKEEKVIYKEMKQQEVCGKADMDKYGDHAIRDRKSVV